MAAAIMMWGDNMLKPEDRINSKKELEEWIKYERTKYPCGTLKRLVGIGELAILSRHQELLRKTEYYLNTKKKVRFVLSKLRLSKIQNKYSLHIPLNCCGKGLKIVHLGPILMNSYVTVGEDCSFHMNSAVVAGGTNDGVPTLGNHVIVGYGACILGDVTIADYVAIGANAVVNKDCIEENVAIAGVPAKIVSRNGSLEWKKS